MIKIDPEFKALIPPLSPEEREQLEANILQDGCRDPLVVWNDVIVDGHNRFEICTRHKLPYDVKRYDFDDRDAAMDWIEKNQLGRRNLSPDNFRIITGRRYLREKKKQGGTGAHRHKEQSGKDYHSVESPSLSKTAARHAAEAGVSEKTIRNNAKAVEALEKHPEQMEAVMRGEKKLHEAVREVAPVDTTPKHEPTMSKAQLAKTPSAVGMYFSKQAIDKLKNIPENDSERGKAFKQVKEWIDENK